MEATRTKNATVAQLFETIADLEEIKGEEAFKSLSYRRAAQYIDKMAEPIEDVARDDKLMDIPGVGKNIAAKIRDILATGTTKHLDDLLREIPAELLDLLAIPGLGPKTASRLYRELGVKGVSDLQAALRDGRVESLKGFGSKKASTILQGLNELAARDKRYLLGYAWPVAEEIAAALMRCAPGARAEVAGSIRRRKDTIADIDIVACAEPGQKGLLADCFTEAKGIEQVLAKGPTKCSIVLSGGMRADLLVVEPEQFATALHHFTGSKEHHVRLRGLAKDLGLKINEYGVFKTGEAEDTGEPLDVKGEQDIYSLLGMEYVPPELREDDGEIEASLERRLPRLVESKDIRGELHSHTSWTDGIDTIEAMASSARSIGYEYIAITDHSKALAFARGLDAERLSEQAKVIDGLNELLEGFKILKGIEVDILADGRLDLPDEVLEGLDIVVASIHSGFRNDQAQIEKRLESACKNPHVDIIGHPSGRIIGRREPYPMDDSRLVLMAKQTGTVLEINASPDRLDISDRTAKKAKAAGVKCSIDTDAHSRRGLSDLPYGLNVARRGWLEKHDVLNSMSAEELLDFLDRKH